VAEVTVCSPADAVAAPFIECGVLVITPVRHCSASDGRCTTGAGSKLRCAQKSTSCAVSGCARSDLTDAWMSIVLCARVSTTHSQRASPSMLLRRHHQHQSAHRRTRSHRRSREGGSQCRLARIAQRVGGFCSARHPVQHTSSAMRTEGHNAARTHAGALCDCAIGST